MSKARNLADLLSTGGEAETGTFTENSTVLASDTNGDFSWVDATDVTTDAEALALAGL